MNPVAMTIFNPWKEYWPSWESNQQPSPTTCMLPTELWSLALSKYDVKRRKCWQTPFSPFPTICSTLSDNIAYLYKVSNYSLHTHFTFTEFEPQ